jgi:hypothetical protein
MTSGGKHLIHEKVESGPSHTVLERRITGKCPKPLRDLQPLVSNDADQRPDGLVRHADRNKKSGLELVDTRVQEPALCTSVLRLSISFFFLFTL